MKRESFHRGSTLGQASVSGFTEEAPLPASDAGGDGTKVAQRRDDNEVSAVPCSRPPERTDGIQTSAKTIKETQSFVIIRGIGCFLCLTDLVIEVERGTPMRLADPSMFLQSRS